MCSLLTWWREHPPAQLNCSDLPAAIALPTRPSHAHVGTITTSEQSALFRPRNNAESARLGPGRIPALARADQSRYVRPLGREGRHFASRPCGRRDCAFSLEPPPSVVPAQPAWPLLTADPLVRFVGRRHGVAVAKSTSRL